MRDFQKSKVYGVENDLMKLLGSTVELAGSKVTLPKDIKFGSLEGVQRYVDRVWKDWSEDTSEAPTVDIRKAKDGPARYSYVGHKITLPGGLWAHREVVVLHEITHALNRVAVIQGTDADHGSKFAGIEHRLFTDYLGVSTGWVFGVLMHQAGVKFDI